MQDMQALQDTRGRNDLEYVIAEYGKAFFTVICSRVRDLSCAEDIYQEVFLLYYTKELHFEDEAARRVWLIRTAVNMSRAQNDSFAQRMRGEADTENIPADTRSPEEERLWNAVCGLKEKYRLPVLLHYYNGMPIDEAAKALGLRTCLISFCTRLFDDIQPLSTLKKLEVRQQVCAFSP